MINRNLCLFFLIHQSDIHASRPHTGQNLVAQRLRALLASSFHPSTISKSHINCGKVQDAYSIRCIPQVRAQEFSFPFYYHLTSIGSWHIMGYDQVNPKSDYNRDE